MGPPLTQRRTDEVRQGTVTHFDDPVALFHTGFHGCTSRPHRLYQNNAVPTDGEAEAMLVPLDDDTALNKTCCLRGVRGLAVVGRGLAIRC